jgi:hypothetical protein
MIGGKKKVSILNFPKKLYGLPATGCRAKPQDHRRCSGTILRQTDPAPHNDMQVQEN